MSLSSVLTSWLGPWTRQLAALTAAEIFTVERVLSVVRALVVVALVLLVLRLIQRRIARLRRLGPHQAMLVRRIVSGVVFVVAAVWVLRELGFDLAPLLGAAGILTVAVGFAAQTSVSNLISGLFLIAERPFKVGDVITVGETTGEVLSVNLMSVKLRMFDNLMVRIPNETMLRSNVINVTHFPIRRLDVRLGVAYKEDVGRVRSALLEVADENPICLEEPKPLVLFLGFGDSSLDLQFSVWATRENFLELRNTIYEGIKRAFEAAGIEIPFPHRTLYAGSQTAPMPVRVLSPEEASGPRTDAAKAAAGGGA